MDLGHLAGCAARRDIAVGNARVSGIARAARLVRLRPALGIHVDDESFPRLTPAVSHGMGGVSILVAPRTARPRPPVDHASRNRRRPRRPLLRPMDHSQLLRLPPVRPASLKFSARTLHRQQRKLRRPAPALSRHGDKRPRDMALPPHGRDSLHGRRDAQSEKVHLCASTCRADFIPRALRGVLGRHPESHRQISGDRFLARANFDPLRSLIGHRRAARRPYINVAPQPLRVSACGIPGDISVFVLRDAHVAAVSPSDRSDRLAAQRDRDRRVRAPLCPTRLPPRRRCGSAPCGSGDRES
jgi:hypothetical protein